MCFIHFFTAICAVCLYFHGYPRVRVEKTADPRPVPARPDPKTRRVYPNPCPSLTSKPVTGQAKPSYARTTPYPPMGRTRTSRKLSFTAGSEHAYVRKLASFFYFIILLAKAALSFLTLCFALLVVFQVSEDISVDLHHSLTTGNSLEVNQSPASTLTNRDNCVQWNVLK
jgi:hypothetical protein